MSVYVRTLIDVFARARDADNRQTLHTVHGGALRHHLAALETAPFLGRLGENFAPARHIGGDVDRHVALKDKG
jgi:hypothetical protein